MYTVQHVHCHLCLLHTS